MRLISFKRDGDDSFGIVVGDGVIDAGTRLRGDFASLRETLQAGALNLLRGMEGLDPDKVRALFGLPADATVTMAISVGEGTPEGLYGPRLRFPLADHLREH